MRVAVAGDHAGFRLKSELIPRLEGLDCEIIHLGAEKYEPKDDYPDFAQAVAEEIRAGRADRGIVVCGSGVGVCIAVNKYPGLRGAVCHDTYSAAQGVQHDDMNVLCLGERVIGPSLAAEVVRAFVAARFEQGEKRHTRRRKKVGEIERRFLRDDRVD